LAVSHEWPEQVFYIFFSIFYIIQTGSVLFCSVEHFYVPCTLKVICFMSVCMCDCDCMYVCDCLVLCAFGQIYLRHFVHLSVIFLPLQLTK